MLQRLLEDCLPADNRQVSLRTVEDCPALLRTVKVAPSVSDETGGEVSRAVVAQAMNLLLFRDLLARETLAPPWRDLLVVLRRMEARGEIRGGRFVSGFVGEQFARPEAVDLLRFIRRAAPAGEEVEIALADPLNLTGVVLPGPRTSALAQGSIRLRDGVAELAESA